jgi:hypothetical protein
VSPTTTLALAKLLGKLEARARLQVAPGEYAVDDTVTLHVQGTLSVGDTVLYKPTVKIPWKQALALFVRYSGVTREAALVALVRAMTEALTTDTEAEDLVAALADLEEAEEQVADALDALPVQPRLGAVNTKQITLEEAA